MNAVIRIETSSPGSSTPSWVGEQYSGLDDVVQAGAAWLEYGLAIRQRLSCLILDRVSARLPLLGSMPAMPETTTCGPALAPWR